MFFPACLDLKKLGQLTQILGYFWRTEFWLKEFSKCPWLCALSLPGWRARQNFCPHKNISRKMRGGKRKDYYVVVCRLFKYQRWIEATQKNSLLVNGSSCDRIRQPVWAVNSGTPFWLWVVLALLEDRSALQMFHEFIFSAITASNSSSR